MDDTTGMSHYNTQAFNRTEQTRKKGISGSTLKLIAIFSMLADHICAVVLTRVVIHRGLLEIAAQDMEAQVNWIAENPLYMVVMLVRLTLGRLAFPIFCFLLVEGFQRTRNVKKYILRLGIFAFLSEIPFDLALTSTPLELKYQNVFFTLFIGLLVMIALHWGEGVIQSREEKLPVFAAKIGKILLTAIILILGMEAAKFLKTDYDALGVLLIAVLYLCRHKKLWQAIGGILVLTIGEILLKGSLSELLAAFAFLPIAFYNGERGLKLKYVFYLFYPLHLLVLYLICIWMGLGNIPAL